MLSAGQLCLADKRKGQDAMKRLKQTILRMEENTKTYKEMYEGRMWVQPYQRDWGVDPYEDMDNTYLDAAADKIIEKTKNK